MKKSAVLTVFLLGVALILAFNHWRIHNRAQAHQIAWTRMDLRIISQAGRTLELDQPSAFSRFFLTNANAHTLYKLLSGTNQGLRFLQQRLPEFDPRNPWLKSEPACQWAE